MTDDINAMIEEIKQRPKWTFDTTKSPTVATWDEERFEGTADECLDWLAAKVIQAKPECICQFETPHYVEDPSCPVHGKQ